VLELLNVPEKYGLPAISSLDASVQDLAHLYAAYSNTGEAGVFRAPGFREAVKMHRFIDAVTRSSDTGEIQFLDEL